MDPFLVQFSPGWGIRWYGTAYLAGFVTAWMAAYLLARRRIIPIPVQLVGDFMTVCVLGVVVGGRVGHALFFQQELLWTFDGQFPYWSLLAIHKGGMSSFGGMIGTMLGMAWMARRHALPFLGLCDVVCLLAPAGLMFGRLANWVNGELWGRVLPESMQANPPWWSVKYPEEALLNATVQTREHVEHLYRMTYSGSVEAAEQIAQLVPARYPNQFFQAFTDGPVLLLVMVLVWLKPRPAGTIFGVFFVAYGVLRVITEQFREPDEGVLAFGPITLPMLMAAAMVPAGAALMRIAARRKGPMVGGFVRHDEPVIGS